jgi:ribokinase
MTVLVLGSINTDLVLQTPRLPRPGETIRAAGSATHPGGKGANQAVAAARMGAGVELVGRVGDDAAGIGLLESLRAAGVGVDGIGRDPGAPTGTALITVAADGSNTIVTSGGANHSVGPEELAAFSQRLPGAGVVLVQLEIPLDVVEAALQMAHAAGVPVVLDPAPVRELPPDLLRLLSWITPNDHEAADLTGMRDPRDAATDLHERGTDHAVVTLGSQGCLYVGLDGTYDIEAPNVDAVDTVACGDAFNGALGARLAMGDEPRDALRWAVGAGALAATREGASTSIPSRSAVEALLDHGDL